MREAEGDGSGVVKQPAANAQLGAGRIFLRQYSADARPWIPFHCDSAAVTVNMALCSHELVEGGCLLVLSEDAVQSIHPRMMGEATVHDSSLLHAVSRVTSAGHGRYSLIIFYDLLPTTQCD